MALKRVNPIILFGQLAASNTDILNGTRLATTPYPGIMTFKYAATVALLSTNAFLVSIAIPGGDVPIDSQMAPLAVGDGNLDDRLAVQISFELDIGGQVLFGGVELGTSIMTWMVRYAPFA